MRRTGNVLTGLFVLGMALVVMDIHRVRAQSIELKPVAFNIGRATSIAHAGDGSGRLFVTSQPGTILIHDGETMLAQPFLDISPKVSCCGEQGLLGIAFHPDYATNGYFYVNYTETLDGWTIVERYSVSPTDPNLADPDSAMIVLVVPQVGANHNGGQLQFGPDGYLYIGTGDGGGPGGGDPLNLAQFLGAPICMGDSVCRGVAI